MEVKSFNPRSGSVSEIVGLENTPDEVDEICRGAAIAGEEMWSMPLANRAELLQEIALALVGSRDDLVEIADRESALGIDRLSGELSRTVNQLRLFSSVIMDSAFLESIVDHANQESAPPSPDLRRQLVPLGPVAVFGSSNFPFAFSVIGGDSASALAAGCPVIVKAHSAHPALSAAVAAIVQQAFVKCGIDSRGFGIVFGREAGINLVEHEDVKAVGFTGSEFGGRTLMDLAARRLSPIPVYAEMGSLNPVVVTASAAQNPEPLVQGLSGSVLLGHGQFCTKPGLIFVPVGSSGDKLVSDLAEALRNSDPQYMLSHGIRDSFISNVKKLAGLPGVNTVVPLRDLDDAGTLSSAGLVETTAVFAAAEPSVMVECFGPAAVIVRYENESDLTEALKSVPASLTLSIHATAEDDSIVRKLVRVGEMQVGRIIINGYPTGVSVTWAQQHGGPYPASSNPLFTSVGATAIRRFLRPVAYQNFPDSWLPEALKESNPLRVSRRVDGVPWTTAPPLG